MLTYVLFFFVVALVTGVFALVATGPIGPIMFFVALILFGWSWIMYIRERRRGTRR
jgi:uncharacterized membrane protein YtjA (UPF0391 family)